MVTRKTLAAALASTSLVLPAQAQNFCQMNGGKVSLEFDIKPSLVAHSDAIMDTTFDDAGLPGGAADELLFSFKRTIGTILETAAAGSNTPAAREAFVQTMLDSFATADGSALNADAGVLMPLDGRAGERLGLTAADLLDDSPGSDQTLKPLAVFNRFDLAPADFIHCGEYRIVYGKINPDVPTPPNRFLLIFEGAVPNPDPATGEAGCRPITEFWAGLSELADDAEVARRLSAFFYEGKTDPSLTASDLGGPVVNYKNYGGDGSRGQVRGNLFMEFPWQLREWLTQPTFDPTNPVAFVRDTVKDNPLAELYQDNLSLPGNIPAAVTALHGNFVASLTSDIRDHLMSEETLKHRNLVKDLDRFDLNDLGIGATKEEAEENILLNTIGLGNELRFNEHQSTSLGNDDAIASKVGPVMRTLLEQVGGTPSPSPAVNPQTADVILARAQAGTCAGCHQLSPGAVVRELPGGIEVEWPAVAAGGFVHVREADRMLSPALEDHFLPVRRYILGRHLCPEAIPPAPVVAALDADAAITALEEAPAPRSAGAMRFVDAIVADFVAAPTEAAGAAAAAADEQPARAAEAIAQLDAAAREALRQRVHRVIAEARREEQNVPGAFVEVRRPH
jgi:hypothetical protein